MKLTILSGGLIDADRAVIFPGDDSHRRVMIPVMQALIEADGRRILVDTGMPPAAAGDPEGLKREYGMDPAWIRALMQRDERVDEQVRAAGVEPQDLNLVVNTHFDFDHAGGNALFTGVTIAAQEAELAAARGSDNYLPVWDAPGLQFRSVSGDWEPLPGVTMLSTPGHSLGHQSMLVELSGGPWLFTWDAVYTEEHWRTGHLGAVRDVAAARASVQRLRDIAADTKARVIFGHDIGQWEALGMAGRHAPLTFE